MAAGKGDRPRKVDGPKYRDNFDSIKWNKDNELRIKIRGTNRENRLPQGQSPKQDSNEH
jgi:hypothetical protein